jgi:C-terminal processing protease CtpA/Prc
MKIIYRIILVFGVLVSLTFCSDREDGVSAENEVNDFVWSGLNSWYYWQPNVPNLADGFKTSSQYSSFISNKNPDSFFYRLLYNYPISDRFSWIVSDVDQLLQSFSGISKTSGMDCDLFYKDAAKFGIVGIVNYVVPNSPAALAGIKRGDVISGVNGSDLNVNNYTALFSEQFTPIIAAVVNVAPDGTITTSGTAKNPNIISTVLEENPVAYYQNYNLGGKKIGYLVYNGFKSNFNDELNAAFAQMKTDGVTDLVLDLRYNGGGSVETAAALGQMITGQFTGSPYVSLEFNGKHTQYNSTEKLKTTFSTYTYTNGNLVSTGTQTANSLNLNKVYILTSSGTASASELTIDGLKSYINVVTVGSETYGKFVGSITLYDSPAQDFISYENRNKSHKWAMQPITFAYFNGNHSPHPTGGFVPDHAVSPKTDFGNLKEFGDYAHDASLKKALELISGQTLKGIWLPAIAQNPDEFVGNRRTLKQFGTEMYIQDVEKLKR